MAMLLILFDWYVSGHGLREGAQDNGEPYKGRVPCIAEKVHIVPAEVLQ